MARYFVGASSQYLLKTGGVSLGTPCTISAWLRAESGDPNNNAAAVGVYTPGNAANLRITYQRLSTSDYTRIGAYASTTGGTAATAYYDITPYTTYDGTWIHVVAVFTSATARELYLNGTSVATNTTNRDAGSSNSTRCVGARYESDAPSLYATVRVAHVGIWSIALSVQEVLSLYNNGSGLYPRIVRPDSLVNVFPLFTNGGNLDWWGQGNLTAFGSPTDVDEPMVVMPSGIWLPQMTTVAAGNRRRRFLMAAS